jgi:predicted 2-oxoglutarate/Fe(II)-dependent dioxygenase YbiX
MPRADFFVSFGLFAQREFLDAALCEELRREMAAASSHPSTVAEDAADAVDESYRSTVSAEVSDATKSLVRNRLEHLNPMLERHFETSLNGCQPPQFLRYREGDYFRAHADREEEGPEWVTERRVSAVVFLNGESGDSEPGSYSGGALTFFGLMGDPRGDAVGFPLVGEEGLLVAFDANLVHSVTPVTRGERYTIVTWFS